MTASYYKSTIHNYRYIKRMVAGRGVKMVCMQYPMRSLEPLKHILDTLEDVRFVDNERSFTQVIAQESYDAYFIDRFAGDFGHATRKGNRLLAENVARVVLQSCCKE